MKKVIILKGLPASGKSSYAKKLIEDNPSVYKRVNKDDLRAMLDISNWSKSNEKFILNLRDTIILMALKEGKSVIVDDTNLASKHEERIKQLVKGLAEIEVKFFDVDIDECIKRDLKRQNSVGEKVIRQMYDQFLKPKPQQPIYDYELDDAIICDIDGTLTKDMNRSPFDWSNVLWDNPRKEVIDIIKHYFWNTKKKIIITSGRDEVCREDTIKWLELNGVNYHELYMRKKDDNRKDWIVKKEIYDNYIKGKYNVKFVIDDRLQVVQMWRGLGFLCLQVEEGNF